MIDVVARRYHRLPHEILALAPADLALALACVEDAAERTRAEMDGVKGVQPVYVLGGL